MAEIRQAVDDRNGTECGQILDLLLFKGADHDAVEIAGQHPCGILHRLAPADLQIICREKQRKAAELVHAGLKGDSRPGGCLLEDHAERFALQDRVRDIVLGLVLQLIRKIENVKNLLLAQIEHFE